MVYCASISRAARQYYKLARLKNKCFHMPETKGNKNSVSHDFQIFPATPQAAH